MSNIISLIYKHKHSVPSPASPLYSEHHALFLPSVSPGEIFHACPSLFSWATNLVVNHDDNVHLRASTNGRCADPVNLVTWEALRKFSIAGLCKKYKSHAPVSWYLTESMMASCKNGIVILKKRHPHPITNLVMVLSIWHFTAKSHVDVKRALDSMTGSSLAILRASVKAATERGETGWCVILHNVQDLHFT
ncbi:hypothetical protein K443DRAFT_130972 [Laccaria amethystina LaAM-08-1]|uniref:Uncharacterized protein n=1 Tax=Laccaria amethystina LaAM-08-1 TaxID=1095629 RepID=A0A0C9XR39_9AGAR|nr:hypothetical protein K443DRAFT_130972 [Laccaria amethystina LaAM-08-1]